jgi:hypothetical protein
MKVTLLSLLVLGATCFASGQAPQSKPNLSGTWIFDAQKSALKVTAPSSMTLQIEQSDPQISLARTQSYGDQNFQWKLAAVTGDTNAVEEKGPGYTTSSRVYWQGNALVIDQQITASDGTKVNDVVTYSLLDGINTLQAVEHQTTVGGKGSFTNKWVYDKKQ